MNFYNDNDRHACAWLRQLIADGLIPPGDVSQDSITDLKPDDLRKYTQVHLFAGIAGWALALDLAGWPRGWPVWTGSCPCQPFSNGGKRRGVADHRHLWPEFRSLIKDCAPATVFGEQVASKDGREWLGNVRSDLEELGYAVGAADLCAASVGTLHVRQRLFWCADTGGERPQGIREATEKPWSRQQFEGLVQAALQVSVPTGKSGGISDGVPARVVRLRGYGNAIVPQVAAAFVRAFLETDEG